MTSSPTRQRTHLVFYRFSVLQQNILQDLGKIILQVLTELHESGQIWNVDARIDSRRLGFMLS